MQLSLQVRYVGLGLNGVSIPGSAKPRDDEQLTPARCSSQNVALTTRSHSAGRDDAGWFELRIHMCETACVQIQR